MTINRAIKIISRASDRYGDKLLEFMKEYKLDGLRDATAEQLAEYITKHNIKSITEAGE